MDLKRLETLGLIEKIDPNHKLVLAQLERARRDLLTSAAKQSHTMPCYGPGGLSFCPLGIEPKEKVSTKPSSNSRRQFSAPDSVD